MTNNGDRHMSEFLPWFLHPWKVLFTDETADYDDRIRRWNELAARWRQIAEGKETPPDLHTPSGEEAEGIMLALRGEQLQRFVINAANRGAVSGLPDSAMLEVYRLVSRAGIVPEEPIVLPPHLHNLVERYCIIHEHTIEAARTGSRDTAMQALMLEPNNPDFAGMPDMLDSLLAHNRLVLENLGYDRTRAPAASGHDVARSGKGRAQVAGAGSDRPVLVAVCAHADDAELNAGGTLAKWVADGGEVRVVMMTNNCSGDLIPADGNETRKIRRPPAETSRTRHREQEAAAGLIGAKVRYLNYWQRHYWNGDRAVDVGYDADALYPDTLPRELCILIACNDAEHIARLGRLLADMRPSLVLTQTPLDVDPEHHAVAAMVWSAFRATPSLKAVPLRFWTPSSGSPGGLVDPHYDRIEDITDHYDMKVRLCAAHASQWSERRRAIVRQRAEYWGLKAGVRYAEPFLSSVETAHLRPECAQATGVVNP